MLDLLQEEPSPRDKVPGVGVGAVGTARALSVFMRHLADDRALGDVVEDEPKGEGMDLQRGSLLPRSPKTAPREDCSVTADAKLVVAAAGHVNKRERAVLVWSRVT